MRVAVVGSRGYPSTYGGFETFVRVVAPFLANRGHDVVVYGRQGGRSHRSMDAEGVTVIKTIGVDSKTLSTLSFGLSSSLDAAARRADVALMMNVANGYYAPVLRAAQIPTLLNVDGIEWMRAKWGRAARAVFRGGAYLSAHFATRLVADSRAIADIWREQFDVSPVFIPYGAALLERRGVDRIEALGLVPESYVLVVARLAPENNVDLTLDAIDSVDPRPAAVVVGSGNYRSALEQRLEDLARRKEVIWLGHVADQELLADLWFHAGVYVHGHSVGGTNPALLQALGAGAPTLAYPSVFNREVVEHGELVFTPQPRELGQEIAAVLSSSERRQQMRQLGRGRIASHYSWHSVCLSYAQQLEQLAAGK
jgi:glycosyltransferase involved in cell wall biosynthesis